MMIKIQRKKRKRKVVKVWDSRPEAVSVEDEKYLSKYRSASNWVARNVNSKEGRKELLFWMKQNGNGSKDIAAIKSLPEWKFDHLNQIAYLANNGWALPADTNEYFSKNLSLGIKEGKQIFIENKKEKDAKAKIDLIKNENRESPELINFLDAQQISDEIQDNIFDDQDIDDTKVLGLFKGKKLIVINKAIDTLKKLKREIDLIFEDPDVTEAYSYLKKSQVKKIANAYDTSIKIGESVKLNKTVGRKPRKVKIKSAAMQIKKLKFKQADKDYNLQSIDPITVIGAKKLIIFNTKYRKLGVYYSKDDNGFQIKGTTLLNIDEQLSEQKTLRETKDSKIVDKLLNFRKATMKQTDKRFAQVTTLNTKLTGRIGGETILLKVFK